MIARHVTLELRLPEDTIAGRHVRKPAATVLVPKASMDENY